MSLTSTIAKGTGYITLSNILTTFLNLISFILIVNLLNRYEYGLIVLALSAVNIANILLDPGIGSVLISDISRERQGNRFDRVKTMIYRYIQIETFLGIIIFLIIFFSSSYFEQKYSKLVAHLVMISSFLIIVNAGKNIFLINFSSHLDFKSIFMFNFIENFSKLVYVIVFGYFLKLGIYGIMIAYPLSTITALIFIYPNYIKIINKYFQITRSKEGFFFRIIKTHGKWAIGIRSVKRFYDNTIPWIIQYFLGVEAVAIFNIAFKAVIYANLLLTSLESALMPIIPREIKNTEKIRKIANKSIKYSFIFSILIVVFSIILAPYIFYYAFGEKYLESINIFRILIFMLFAYSLNLPMRPIFFSMRLQRYLFNTYVINLLLLLLFSIILIQFIGFYGIIYALIINGFLTFLLRYWYIRKFGITINFREFIKFDEYDRRLLIKFKTKVKKYL